MALRVFVKSSVLSGSNSGTIGPHKAVALEPNASLVDALRGEVCDLLFVDCEHLGEAMEEALAELIALPDGPEAVVVSRVSEPAEHARLLAAGATCVIPAGLPADEAERVAAAILARIEERRGRIARSFPPPAAPIGTLASASPEMRRVLATAARAAETDVSLVLTGETGSGKEWLARDIHASGRRGRGPFVAVNCAALTEGLIESELFGHARGAFTGAHRAHRGLFEVAGGGTLFLDEVGELPLAAQAKLLRILQEREVRPVGSETSHPVDVRLIAATLRDLEAEVEAGRFRADLFYRISVVTLELPPLRDRVEDVPVLAEQFLEQHSTRLGKTFTSIAPDAARRLAAYPWPGNVRELSNVIERTVLLSSGPVLELANLPDSVRDPRPVSPPFDLTRPLLEAREAVVRNFEREYISALLKETAGRVGKAAHRAGLSERAFYSAMQRHGLHKEAFRAR